MCCVQVGATPHNNFEILSARLCQRCCQRPAYARVLQAVAFSALRQQREGRGHENTFYELALQNPGVVAWYCTLKLEMCVHLAKEIITRTLQSDIVPGRQEAMARLEAELQQKLGLEVSVSDLPDLQYYGYVDVFYASLEWSVGGLIHTHIAFWIVG